MKEDAVILFDSIQSICTTNSSLSPQDAIAGIGSALGWAIANIIISYGEDSTPDALKWIEAGKKATFEKCNHQSLS